MTHIRGVMALVQTAFVWIVCAHVGGQVGLYLAAVALVVVWVPLYAATGNGTNDGVDAVTTDEVSSPVTRSGGKAP